jgi:hypothetical protein
MKLNFSSKSSENNLKFAEFFNDVQIEKTSIGKKQP